VPKGVLSKGGFYEEIGVPFILYEEFRGMDEW